MGKEYYYRIMKTPSMSWEPYRYEVGTPKEGDYIIRRADGTLQAYRPTAPEHFEGAQFEAMPTLAELKDDSTLIMTPERMMELDCYLQCVMFRLSKRLYDIEARMETLEEEMTQRKFGFLTKVARAARKEYTEQKLRHKHLEWEYDEFETRLTKQVLTPLQEKLEERRAELEEMLLDTNAPLNVQIRDAAMPMIQQPMMTEAEAEFEL